MKLFGKKKKEEEKEEEPKNPRKQTFPKRELTEKEKFFKEKKEKKKKFEITPWSPRERMLVFGVFISTVLTSALLGLSAREWKLPNMPRVKLDAPSLFPSEKIIIEKSDVKPKDSEVIERVRELTEPLSGVYGFFVVRLGDGSFYGMNEHETFEAGSLNKLPVMLTMYKEAERGNVNLSTVYLLKDSDKIPGSGSLSGAPAGTKITYAELVERMGQESDNTAFNITRRLMGDDKILALMQNTGLSDSLLEDNEITPYEIAFFLKGLMDLDYSSRETRDALTGYMTNTIYEDWISKDIPVPVAHKFGTLPHVRNDAGIVMGEKPYVLVVMSKGVIEKEADEVIPQISQVIFQDEEKQ